MATNKELSVKEQGYLMATNFNVDLFCGEEPSFAVIKTPSAGGLAFEVPGDDPESPDMVKEVDAAIVCIQKVRAYYKDKFEGGNQPPDCGSFDGKMGVDGDGVVNACNDCPYNEYGSADDGEGKACKERRNIYIMRQGELLPVRLALSTGSLKNLRDYVNRLVRVGKNPLSVVTKFKLKKADSRGGITYSQVTFTAVRDLAEEERASLSVVSKFIEQYVRENRTRRATHEELDNPFDKDE